VQNIVRKNILILVVVAAAAYAVGLQTANARDKNYEDLRHQLERLWNDPHARKSRQELARKAAKAAKQAARAAQRRRG
jgi:hypothetical protein